MTIRVLLADDHAVVRDGLRALLNDEADINVIGDACDGRDALKQTIHLCPDIVIMDIAMPYLNGIDATRRIREARSSVQVVILSMYSTNEHVSQSLRAGAIGYVLKESSGRELVDAIHSVNVGRRYISRQIADQVIEDCVQQRMIYSPLARLTPHEREILQLVSEGKSSADISRIMCLSQKTVETYRSRIANKLGVRDVPSLVKFAIQHGLTSL